MHPELFHLFGRPVYSYGFMLGIAFIAGWYLLFWLARRDGMEVDRFKNIVFAGLIGAIFFSRVLYFITNPDRWVGIVGFFQLQDGGLVAYGGYLGGIGTAYLGFRLIKADFWRFMDHVAPNLALGLGLVRIGCFLNGCDFGGTCDLPWAMSFPPGSPAFERHQSQGLIAGDAEGSLPVHPTQLYASLYGFALFGFLLWAHGWRRRFYGQTLMLFLGIYGVLRFLNEILRDDPQRGHYGVLSTSQWISLVMVGLAVGLPFYLIRHHRPE